MDGALVGPQPIRCQLGKPPRKEVAAQQAAATQQAAQQPQQGAAQLSSDVQMLQQPSGAATGTGLGWQPPQQLAALWVSGGAAAGRQDAEQPATPGAPLSPLGGALQPFFACATAQQGQLAERVESLDEEAERLVLELLETG